MMDAALVNRVHSQLGALATLLLLATIFPGVASAQNQDESWDWQLTIYGWLPTISGETQLPTGAGGPSIEVDPETLIDNLSFTFMGALQGRSAGEWGFFTDLIYLDESASGTLQNQFTIGGTPIPADVSMDLGLELTSWVWTLAPTYTLSESKTHVTDAFIGFRMIDIDSVFNWTFNGDIGPIGLPGRTGLVAAGDTNWDAIIGLKGHRRFGTDGKWMMPWHFDIGSGDSDLTWQAMAGVGYEFSWGTALLTYRYLDYDLGSKGTLTELDFGGFMIGASFNW